MLGVACAGAGGGREAAAGAPGVGRAEPKGPGRPSKSTPEPSPTSHPPSGSGTPKPPGPSASRLASWLSLEGSAHRLQHDHEATASCHAISAWSSSRAACAAPSAPARGAHGSCAEPGWTHGTSRPWREQPCCFVITRSSSKDGKSTRGRTFFKLWLASATLAAVRRPHHQSQHRLRHCRTKLRSVFGRRAAAPHPSHHAPSPTALAVPLASILLPLLASSPSPLPMHAPALVHCAPHLVGRRPRLPPLHARRAAWLA